MKNVCLSKKNFRQADRGSEAHIHWYPHRTTGFWKFRTARAMSRVSGIDPSMAGTPGIDTSWLEEGKEMAECPACLLVLEQPVAGCPEGHAFCRRCYLTWLGKKQECPTCSHATHCSQLQRCRPLEDLIGQLRTRCKHGVDDLSAKRAKLDPEASSADDLRRELGLRGLSTDGENKRSNRRGTGQRE